MQAQCASCKQAFRNEHAVTVHKRRSDCGRMPSEPQSRGQKRRRPLPLPLQKHFGGDNGTEQRDELRTRNAGVHIPVVALPQNRRDNVLLEDEGEYWGGLVERQNFASPDAPREASFPTSGDPGPSVPVRGEVISAGREIIISAAEKVGAREMDAFLRLVTSPGWAEVFRSEASSTLPDAQSLTSVAKAHCAVQEELDKNFAHLGFNKVKLFKDREARVGLDVFIRSPLQVVRQLMEHASAERQNFFFDPVKLVDRDGKRLFKHPMSCDIAHEALRNVKETIFAHKDASVCWTDDSFVALLQVYSDKSCMSLKSTALSFYPLHVSVLGFSSSEREAAIRRGDSLVAFLPVDSSWPSPEREVPAFQADGEPVPLCNQQGCRENATTDSGGKRRPIRADTSLNHGNSSSLRANALPVAPETRDIMSKALALVLDELRASAEQGVIFRDADGVYRKAHLVLASYVADTPEVSTVACTMNNRCARCDVPLADMGTPGLQGTPRAAALTEKLLLANNYIQSGSAVGDESSVHQVISKFPEYAGSGITSTRPHFIDWPFVSVHPALDTYRIMRGDLMHSMPLGILKTLVTLVTQRLRSDTLTTSVFLDSKRRPKTLRSMRSFLLGVANEVLANISREAPATDFRVNFSRHKAVTRLDGLFTDSGVASMLEARDMKNVQQVLPFCAAVLDKLQFGERLSQNTKTTGSPNAAFAAAASATPPPDSTPMQGFPRLGHAPLTSVFVAYNELYGRLVGGNDEEVGFTESDLVGLETCIGRFKSLCVHVFGDYQASRFCFPKFHALEHVVRDIRDLGCPTFYSADAYEASHILFKAKNRATSRRRSTAMTETAAKISRFHGMRNARLTTGAADGYRTLFNPPLTVGAPTPSQPRPWVVQALVEGKSSFPIKASPNSVNAKIDVSTSGPNAEQVNDDSEEDKDVFLPKEWALPQQVRRTDVDQITPGADAALTRPTAERLSKMTPKAAAMATDSCCLVRARGRSVSFKCLFDAVRAVQHNSGAAHPQNVPLSTAPRSALSEGELFVASIGGYALAKKALNIICTQSCGEDLDRLSVKGVHLLESLRFNFTKSAYVAGFRSPSLDDQTDVFLQPEPNRSANDDDAVHEDENAYEPSVLLENDGARCLQKVLSSLSYSHSTGIRQDSVLIQGEDSSPGENMNASVGMEGSLPLQSRIQVWFAKVLLFTHVSANAGAFKDREELAVVRYYTALPKTFLGAADEALGCIKLKWAKDVHKDPWIDVVPASSIRGRLHVVPGDVSRGLPYNAGADRQVRRENAPDERDRCEDSCSDSEYSDSDGVAMFADSATWRERRFFVNRFKSKNYTDVFYNVIDM